jgi:hypothetical protein
MATVLSQTQIEQFIEDGFVRLDNAFAPALAQDVRTILWQDMDCEQTDPSTWTQAVIRLGMYAQPPFIEAANTPTLHQAFDQLVGAGRWLPCRSVGTFPVRFPAADEPLDAGWHVDASFPGADPGDYAAWRINSRSSGRALLLLFLFSDIGENDAPTRIRIGSHQAVARLLKPFGNDGLSFMELAGNLHELPQQQETTATGKAGTVYLCHPFLVHAAQAHRGNEPRFLAQPPLLLADELRPDGPVEELMPVEEAIRRGTR